MARIETMACRLAFGRSGSGSGRGSTSGGSGRRVLHSKSAFHIVASAARDWMGRCGCPGNSPDGGGGFADTHNRLSSRCQSIVWFLTLRPGAVPGLVTGYLPEAGPDCRKASEPGFRPEGGNPFPDVPFELSGAQARAPGVFPQPSKTAVWTQSTDIKGIKPIGRLSDSVR